MTIHNNNHNNITALFGIKFINNSVIFRILSMIHSDIMHQDITYQIVIMINNNTNNNNTAIVTINLIP